MIKVIDEVTGTSIKIEVIGKPYQYMFRAGKIGTWTVARGRTAGKVKTGEKWGRAIYVRSLKMGFEAAFETLSEEEALLTIDSMAHADEWKKLIELEEIRIRMVEKVDEAYGQLIEEHGKDLAGLTKLLGGKPVKEEAEEEEAEDTAEDLEDSEESEE